MFFTILVWRYPSILNTPHIWRRLCVQLALLGDDLAPDVAALCAAVLRVALLCGLLAGAVGAVALLLANPQIVLCGLGIALFGWATYPRMAVK
jgi:hypothetical protein